MIGSLCTAYKIMAGICKLTNNCSALYTVALPPQPKNIRIVLYLQLGLLNLFG
jgi:hypothetical protein